MGEFKHQHTADLSASLTCSTMSLGIEQIKEAAGSAELGSVCLDESHQYLDGSIKILLMRLLVKALSGKSDFVALISMAEELLSDAPNSVYLHYALGTAFSKTGNHEKAIQHCRKFVEIHAVGDDTVFQKQNLATTHNNLAVCLKTIGLLDPAEQNFKKAIELDDGFAAAFNNYGNLLNDKARIQEAQQNFVRAIEINPDDHVAYWNLHSTSKSIDEAKSIIELCVSKAPTDEIAIFTLAGLRALEGDRRDLEELARFGFSEEPLIRSIFWVLSLPKIPRVHFNRWSLFDHAIKLSDRSRPFYEFGVWMGDSFGYLVDKFDEGFGFDTFQGLPEDWGVIPRGAYSSYGRVPEIENSTFIVGEFEETLPNFFAKKREKAGLINFDADLYSSTLTALTNAKPVIDSNTVLVFDEFIVNNNWEGDEFRAMNEFCVENGLSYEVEGVSLFTKQVMCRISPAL